MNVHVCVCVYMCVCVCIYEYAKIVNEITSHVWQSRVENEHYSVVYFDHICAVSLNFR